MHFSRCHVIVTNSGLCEGGGERVGGARKKNDETGRRQGEKRGDRGESGEGEGSEQSDKGGSEGGEEEKKRQRTICLSCNTSKDADYFLN